MSLSVFLPAMLCFFKHFTTAVFIIKQQLNFPCFLAVVLSTVTLLCLNFQMKAGMIKFKEQFNFGNILIWTIFNIWKYFYHRQCLKKLSRSQQIFVSNIFGFMVWQAVSQSQYIQKCIFMHRPFIRDVQ